ncbi:YtpI family protein [Bacillus aquiflavi]|uniref:YtpI family protein n=1 Tax=Bacillus aquiflavi TaxID=2672567 RepID=A0A6B3VYQ9_9BACI|nr:YtpI family protein [Bacillus aquiflavi]MBA4537118.1 YtpI family protein [Bacillus aquiflavi]NEY81415.1 hypothetical protein [Bacillus aquiflavi]UAC47548.1 YtpI family protein [Bacillus aquiflavi]
MFVLVVLIGISLALYLFYKMRFFRSRLPAEKKWLSSKSGMALGFFILLFGINQLFLFQTVLTYIVSAIFIFLGVINVWAGYKAYKHYLPYAIEEAEKLEEQ